MRTAGPSLDSVPPLKIPLGTKLLENEIILISSRSSTGQCHVCYTSHGLHKAEVTQVDFLPTRNLCFVLSAFFSGGRVISSPHPLPCLVNSSSDCHRLV